MRAIHGALMASFGLLLAACVSLTPEEEARHTLFWEAAKECEGRYRTIRVRHVDPDGGVHIEDYAQAEVEEFISCYERVAQEKLTGR